MDNIQKAILGVLGVAGLIAMMVPAENPIAPPSIVPLPSDTAAAPQPLPPQEPANVADELLPADDGDFQIGEPSIDGKPAQPDFGMPFGSTENNSSSDENNRSSDGNADEPKSRVSGYVPPSPSEIPGMPAAKIKLDGLSPAEN